MKFIVRVNHTKDSVDDTYVVDSLREVGLAVAQFERDYEIPEVYFKHYVVEIIPVKELRKEKKDEKVI